MSSRHPRGFAMVSAVFLLVVLVSLGAFIASTSIMHATGSAADVAGAQAYQAARSGTEWAASQIVNSSSCAASTNLGTVNGMTVTVTCTSVASGNATEVGLGTIYSITATACNTPVASACPGTASSANYVERSVTIMLEN